jgi:hypothetical protein
MKHPPNLHETVTECFCERPLLNDERVIGMGVNCAKCGRSAERHLTNEQRRDLRDYQRGRRSKREESEHEQVQG